MPDFTEIFICITACAAAVGFYPLYYHFGIAVFVCHTVFVSYILRAPNLPPLIQLLG